MTGSPVSSVVSYALKLHCSKYLYQVFHFLVYFFFASSLGGVAADNDDDVLVKFRSKYRSFDLHIEYDNWFPLKIFKYRLMLCVRVVIQLLHKIEIISSVLWFCTSWIWYTLANCVVPKKKCKHQRDRQIEMTLTFWTRSSKNIVVLKCAG